MPDDFVLVGSQSQQLRQIGNAVPWCLREAIGRELAKAIRQSGVRREIDVDSHNDINDNRNCNSDDSGDTDKDYETDNNDNEDDVVFSTKAEYESARTKRMNDSTSQINPNQDPISTTKYLDQIPATSSKQAVLIGENKSETSKQNTIHGLQKVIR